MVTLVPQTIVLAKQVHILTFDLVAAFSCGAGLLILQPGERIGGSDEQCLHTAGIGGAHGVVLTVVVHDVRIGAVAHHRELLGVVLLVDGAADFVSTGLGQVDLVQIVLIPVDAEVEGGAIGVSGGCRGTLGEVAVVELCAAVDLREQVILGGLVGLHGDVCRDFHTSVVHAAKPLGQAVSNILGKRDGVAAASNRIIDTGQVSLRALEAYAVLDFREGLKVLGRHVLGSAVHLPRDTVFACGSVVSSCDGTGIKQSSVRGDRNHVATLVLIRLAGPVRQIAGGRESNLAAIYAIAVHISEHCHIGVLAILQLEQVRVYETTNFSGFSVCGCVDLRLGKSHTVVGVERSGRSAVVQRQMQGIAHAGATVDGPVASVGGELLGALRHNAHAGELLCGAGGAERNRRSKVDGLLSVAVCANDCAIVFDEARVGGLPRHLRIRGRSNCSRQRCAGSELVVDQQSFGGCVGGGDGRSHVHRECLRVFDAVDRGLGGERHIGVLGRGFDECAVVAEHCGVGRRPCDRVAERIFGRQSHAAFGGAGQGHAIPHHAVGNVGSLPNLDVIKTAVVVLVAGPCGLAEVHRQVGAELGELRGHVLVDGGKVAVDERGDEGRAHGNAVRVPHVRGLRSGHALLVTVGVLGDGSVHAGWAQTGEEVLLVVGAYGEREEVVVRSHAGLRVELHGEGVGAIEQTVRQFEVLTIVASQLDGVAA